MEIKTNQAKAISPLQILEAIKHAKCIGLTVHVHPDGDALGSMLALYEYLVNENKQVYMIVDDVIPKKFKALPYMDSIYKPKDFVNFDALDLLIVLDASTFERLGRIGELVNCTMINIDHHISNSHYAHYLYLDSKAAATGEIMTFLFNEWKANMTPTMANALYLAIATDCGFFKYGNTTEATLVAASICVRNGGNPIYVSTMVDTSTASRLEATAKALKTVRFYEHNKIGSIVVDHLLMQEVEDDTDGFVDYVLNVEGILVALLFKEYTSQQTRVSFRSRLIDVNKIAASFGGGGHIRASGCTVKLPLAQAIPEVVERVRAYIEEETLKEEK